MMYEWAFRLAANITQALQARKKPKPRQLEYYFKCPYCINHYWWCSDLDVTRALVQDHNSVFHPEMEN